MDKLFVAFGAITAALIAGYFAFMALINAKEQKTSEFRQSWIDALRADISKLCASVHFTAYYCGPSKVAGAVDVFQFRKNMEGTHKEYIEAVASILMRVNPLEKEGEAKRINEAFLLTMNLMQAAYNSRNYDLAARYCDQLIDQSKPLLKLEWNRVKRGERSFILSKYSAAIVFIAGFFLVGAVGLKIYKTEEGKDTPKNAVLENLCIPTPEFQSCSISFMNPPK